MCGHGCMGCGWCGRGRRRARRPRCSGWTSGRCSAGWPGIGRAGWRRSKGGIAGSQGAPSFLTPEQQAELADEVATGRFRTAAEIRQWVEERWGVSYTEGGMYALLEPAAVCPEGAATRPREDRPPRAGAVEKGGLATSPRRGRPDAERVGSASATSCGSGCAARRDGSGAGAGSRSASDSSSGTSGATCSRPSTGRPGGSGGTGCRR